VGPHALTEHVAPASALPLGVSKNEESMTIPHDLLNDLRSSATDLARIVEAVFRDGLPYVMIPSQAIRSWERPSSLSWTRLRPTQRGRGCGRVRRPRCSASAQPSRTATRPFIALTILNDRSRDTLHNSRTALAHHPDPAVVDATLKLPAAAVLLKKGDKSPNGRDMAGHHSKAPGLVAHENTSAALPTHFPLARACSIGCRPFVAIGQSPGH